MNGPDAGRITLGIYEKALDGTPIAGHAPDWPGFFGSAVESGFSFVDLSVDESPERRDRLRWTADERRAVRRAATDAGVAIGGICLSVHRAVGLASTSPDVRREAARILDAGIALCGELGVPVLQLAGYYDHYARPAPGQHEMYVEQLRRAADVAAQAGVLLGIENTDGVGITSISGGMTVVRAVGSPWLQLYPDIGNIAEQGLDTTAELRAGEGHMLALHVKDVRRGEPRRVPLGTGIADFPAAFAELRRQRWSGRIMIEMWNDDAPDSGVICRSARDLVDMWLTDAGIPVTCRQLHL